MPNGDDPVWKAIEGLRLSMQELSVDGCAFRTSHEKMIEDEKKERKESMDELKKDIKDVRNQILLGIVALMGITLLVDKVLK